MSGLPGRADAAAIAADSMGGMRAIPTRPAPPFRLIDQRGRTVSIAGFRGKLVVLTFLDAARNWTVDREPTRRPADEALGPLARSVEFVAIDTNPVFHFVGDVAAFTDSTVERATNWHLVTGAPDTVQNVLSAYGISVAVPAVGMVEHSEALYLLTPDGREAGYLEDAPLRSSP